MATRKQKHAKALEKRENFFKTVKQGNQDWLAQAQAERVERRKNDEARALERKKEKSRKLAFKNGAIPGKNSPKITPMNPRPEYDRGL